MTTLKKRCTIEIGKMALPTCLENTMQGRRKSQKSGEGKGQNLPLLPSCLNLGQLICQNLEGARAPSTLSPWFLWPCYVSPCMFILALA